MLRRIRVLLASVCFVAVTLLFLDFTGTLHAYLGWAARIQLLPALLAGNLLTVLVLALTTLVVGRVYCSVVCPMGVMQDIIARLGRIGRRRRGRYSYSPERRVLRYGLLAVYALCLVAGVAPVVALLAPYSSYGRIASSLLAPLYKLGNNALALIAAHADSYAFYSVDVWVKSGLTLCVAAATLAVVFVLAWRGGRTYCNTVCPVGTLLSLLARFSLFRPQIDGSKCRGCSLCARRCKAACIDYRAHRIDASRCVACMNCLDNCHFGAIRLAPAWRQSEKGTDAPAEAEKTTQAASNAPASAPSATASAPASPASAPQAKGQMSRRAFVAGGLSLTAAAALRAQTLKVDGGLAVIEDKQIPHRHTPLVPAGAQGLAHFAAHCTACQICVSECPNDVLRPASSLSRLMQPEMQYERGYCRPECTRCSEVCPAGAILPVTREEKSSVRIGHAVWVRKNCVPVSDGHPCDNCARHCPSGAILMVPLRADEPEGLHIPVVNTEKCIGCGACEHLCPARPFSAIYVEGNEAHSRY